MSPSHISVKYSNGGPNHFKKRKQEIRVTHIRQKRLFLFEGNIIVYSENPREPRNY